MDIAAVLGDVADIQNAALRLLQQFHRHIDQIFDPCRTDPRRTVFMEITRYGFKRRTRFARQKYRGRALCRRFDFAVHLLNRGTVAQLVEHRSRVDLRRTVLQRVFDGRQQLLQGNRFFQKIDRTDFGRFYGGIDAGMPAHHHHRHIELPVFRPLFQKGNTVAIGHPNIQQHHRRARLMAQLARLFGIFRQCDRIAFVLQDFRQQVADADFVIYN